MTKKPLYNALAAITYIITIVVTINFIDEFETNIGTAQFVMPIVMLSMFTLSAAIMAYIFCYQPLRLFLEKKQEEAIKLFLNTVGIFAVIIVAIVLGYLLIITV